jgi:hypothetical protein
MLGFGASARETIDKPAPKAKAPAAAAHPIAKVPAAIIAEPIDANPAIAAIAILLPQN